jgi:hypothetical protein
MSLHTPTSTEPFPAGHHPLDWKRRVLPGFAAGICRAAAAGILCDRDASGRVVAPKDDLLDRVVDKLDLWLGSTSPELGKAFVALCLAVDAGPLVVMRKPRRMSSLTLEDRLHYFEKLEEHESGLMSMLLMAFKVPLATAAFEHGEWLHRTGFDREDLIVRRSLRKEGSAT